MYPRLHPRRLLASLVLFGLLLQTLLPAMAGMREESKARWIEVCAASGIKWVKLDQPGDHSSKPAHGGHCALCAATGAAPEFDARQFLLAASGVSHAPATGHAAPPHRFPGHSLRSRAPPVLS